jgi:murein DD-endopeptidase MepM/ murein hydrolase activator NlpD
MSNDECGGTIAISNGKFEHIFCHCSKIDVIVGQNVKQGEVVGLTGGARNDTGRGHSTGPHLHWQKKNLLTGSFIDPTRQEI